MIKWILFSLKLIEFSENSQAAKVWFSKVPIQCNECVNAASDGDCDLQAISRNQTR